MADPKPIVQHTKDAVSKLWRPAALTARVSGKGYWGHQQPLAEPIRLDRLYAVINILRMTYISQHMIYTYVCVYIYLSIYNISLSIYIPYTYHIYLKIYLIIFKCISHIIIFFLLFIYLKYIHFIFAYVFFFGSLSPCGPPPVCLRSRTSEPRQCPVSWAGDCWDELRPFWRQKCIQVTLKTLTFPSISQFVSIVPSISIYRNAPWNTVAESTSI